MNNNKYKELINRYKDLKRYDEYILKHFVNFEPSKDDEIAMLKSKVEYLENKFGNVG